MTGVLTTGCIDAALAEAQPTLNIDQATAVRTIATSGNGVDTIQALAGAGKTKMMRTLANAYRQAGYHAHGTAPTARAARELRDVAGVPSNTMHALSRQLDGRRLRPGTVLPIDGAGMAGTRISSEILRLAEHAGVKVIAVVDAWVRTRAEQPDADVVMIARDNETREQLNRAARVPLRERGEVVLSRSPRLGLHRPLTHTPTPASTSSPTTDPPNTTAASTPRFIQLANPRTASTL